MLINLSDILSKEGETQRVEAMVDMENFTSRLGTFPVQKKTPVHFTIKNKGKKVLQINGEGSLTLLIPCGRCLSDVPVEFVFDFEREVDMKQSEEERIKDLDESNYITGGNLDVEQLVYNEILINWPLRVLCKDDCKGICSHCGKNLNQGPCDCRVENLDPRMAVISDIFSKFKEV
ncbi:DUF177 domain-containing protein [Lactonifactor longoviformis]|uniref:DUF177 domain-containing protein n=1 Tax=Lactonifactor longoviformis DSM 17459 TaxID=1122155 RepID=A0A1M4YS64_9CLOT|nr:DUF177 domain-containing protein [Lactonifactor longoviformis]POP31906.1 DUF177 domain-containing protein [Lactonifactor longoviformis]SHF08467.1 uncharacterized protein SAMN02745158_02478 [Lactonifactor longoviformis DSM 17459]